MVDRAKAEAAAAAAAAKAWEIEMECKLGVQKKAAEAIREMAAGVPSESVLDEMLRKAKVNADAISAAMREMQARFDDEVREVRHVCELTKLEERSALHALECANVVASEAAAAAAVAKERARAAAALAESVRVSGEGGGENMVVGWENNVEKSGGAERLEVGTAGENEDGGSDGAKGTDEGVGGGGQMVDSARAIASDGATAVRAALERAVRA
eukprot:965706-Pleurochrysis_carterae.AAC.1